MAPGSVMPLRLRQTLYRDGEAIRSVCFVGAGVVSLVNYLDDGRAVETSTVGREGFVGMPAFWGPSSMPGEAFVQVEGVGLVIPVRTVAPFTRADTPLHDLLQRYSQALFTQVAQSSACNRIHGIVERCARWILMTRDRVDADTFLLTQEFLAQMLGVRRAGVSAAAGALQRAGHITYSRGRITVLDRDGLESAACSCYAVVKQEFDRLLPPS